VCQLLNSLLPKFFDSVRVLMVKCEESLQS